MPIEAPSASVISIGSGPDCSEATEAQASAALAELYAGALSPGAVLREGARPLRILVLAPEHSVYQRFSARDMSAGLASLGVNVTTCMVGEGRSWRIDLLNLIGHEQPDAVFVFSQRRETFPVLPCELSVLVWDQDYTCGFNCSGGWQIGPHDRIWTLMDEWQDRVVSNGVDRRFVGHLNMGANTDLFTTPTGEVEFEHDVLFIGNIHPFERYRAMIGLDRWPVAAQKVMLHARERLYEWLRTREAHEPYILPEMEGFLLESARAVGVGVSTETDLWALMVRLFRYRIAHYVVRECVIESLAGYRLGLYGQGWDKFPKLAPLAKPAINNGIEMLRVMHRSAVHVQLHTWTVHHPRLYDTAAAGGYLLVGRVPERRPLELEFDVGTELESFGSIAELHKKIDTALGAPAMLRSVGARAAQRVRDEHTMVNGARKVLEELRRDQP